MFFTHFCSLVKLLMTKKSNEIVIIKQLSFITQPYLVEYIFRIYNPKSTAFKHSVWTMCLMLINVKPPTKEQISFGSRKDRMQVLKIRRRLTILDFIATCSKGWQVLTFAYKARRFTIVFSCFSCFFICACMYAGNAIHFAVTCAFFLLLGDVSEIA